MILRGKSFARTVWARRRPSDLKILSAAARYKFLGQNNAAASTLQVFAKPHVVCRLIALLCQIRYVSIYSTFTMSSKLWTCSHFCKVK